MTITFAHRHVLEARVAGLAGGTGATTSGANRIAVVRRPAIVTVLAESGQEADVDLALSLLDGVAARACGPAEWLAVSQEIAGDALVGLAAGIDGASLVDQSDGRVLLQIAGPDVRKILAKCLAVDLHPEVFAEGQSGNMLICHVSGNLACTGADMFEIIVQRSYAGWVFDDLMEMGREFGLAAGFA